MNWKNLPYWVKGTAISAGCILLFSIIVSIAVASSPICGMNSAGESHTCNLSERIHLFGWIMNLIFIFSFKNTLRSIFEYRSIEILRHATDGFFIAVTIVCALLLGGCLGWMYGKIKNHRKVKVNGTIS